MIGFDLNSLKRKAEEAKKAIPDATPVIIEKVDKAKRKGSELAKEALSTADSLAGIARTTVETSEIGQKAKETIVKAIDSARDAASKAKDNLDKPKILMEHKILMMGGRRAGKSTILSSILSQLQDHTPGKACVVVDKTDYSQQRETKKGLEPLTTLYEKQYEIQDYITRRDPNTEFLVNMGPTYGKASYILGVTAKTTGINLEFVDVPGEWMDAAEPGHAKLLELIKECDCFVIAIDTPFLMNVNDSDPNSININNVCNRVKEITDSLSNIQIKTEFDLKQIILCPVKCEKWVRSGHADDVVAKVKEVYANLINMWIPAKEVTIQIMPIQTVGGFESSKLLPAKLYFKDEDERAGVPCSEDPETGLILRADGEIIKPRQGSRTEVDKAWFISHVNIPLSWYKINGAGYAPKFCEQPGFHILKFLVEKEEYAIRSKAEAEADIAIDKPWWWIIFTKIFKPTFGKYLPVWRDVINELNNAHCIKTQGDGFCYVRETIN